MNLYKFVVGFVAFGVAGCAAFFSVLGIATFLGGNFLEVAIMAGFLEAGKLVCASAAYRFRKVASTWVRGLLVTFTIIMMFITSAGIFGFLSDSYRQAASQRDISEQKIANVESKRQTFEERVSRLEEDRQRLLKTQKELESLRREQGWLSERQAERLSQIPNELGNIDSSLTGARDSVLTYQQRATEMQAGVEGESELGPILFVADAVGLPQNQAALYFILLLIFVFDPMAVTLIVALSMATGIEETVEEEDIEEVGDEVESDDEEKSAMEVAEEVGKPLPDDEEETEQTPEEGQTAKGRIDRIHEYASIGDSIREIHEDRRMDNSEFEEKFTTVEQAVESENHEEPQESGNKQQEEELDDSSDEVDEWLEEARSESSEPEDKPWENPFREPFGNFDNS